MEELVDKLLENPNDQGAEKLALDIAKRYGVTDRGINPKTKVDLKGKLIPIKPPRRGHRTRETEIPKNYENHLVWVYTMLRLWFR